jgi:PAT family beta-lactamase induction signal transducer AmpG
MDMSHSLASRLANRRLLSVMFMGFASGLPLALTASTLQAWFTQANVNLLTIGALSLVGIPYTLKFLWAPMLDYFNLPRFGKRQGWVILSQLLLAAALFTIAHMQPSSEVLLMGMVAVVIAFLSATQDIAIDAYRTDVLTPDERGLGASYTIFTYRIAVLISGGLALVFADYLGWKATYELMSALMLLSVVPTIFAPRPVEMLASSHNVFQTAVSAVRDLVQHDNFVLLIFFIMFYKFGDALALQLFTNFLLHGLGFTLTEVGLAYKIVSFVATISGAFIGGLLLSRFELYRSLLWFGLAQAFSNLMFVWLAIVGKSFALMTASIFVENFCSGLSTAALFAFMMSLCNSRYSATQYALLSAIASLGRVLLGPFSAHFVQSYGWTTFFFWAFLLSFPGLIFLILLRNKVSGYVHVVE